MTTPDEPAVTAVTEPDPQPPTADDGDFHVSLPVFSGPFDLLLSLISRHRLDITEVALAQVTDEFISYIAKDWDLGKASEFLVVAATLLDLKAARLLPRGDVESEEDLELLEARDLLFARLLQYRAFKDVAAHFDETMSRTGRMTPRQAGLEPHLASLLPELVISVTPEQLARVAARALTPKEPETIGLTHLHAPAVSVREQAVIVVDRLRGAGSASFRDLVRDADSTLVVVARFLALLELFRDRQVVFDQPEALGEFDVRWTGTEEGAVDVGAEFDEEEHDE